MKTEQSIQREYHYWTYRMASSSIRWQLKIYCQQKIGYIQPLRIVFKINIEFIWNGKCTSDKCLIGHFALQEIPFRHGVDTQTFTWILNRYRSFLVYKITQKYYHDSFNELKIGFTHCFVKRKCFNVSLTQSICSIFVFWFSYQNDSNSIQNLKMH